jgi:hypothetical protein
MERVNPHFVQKRMFLTNWVRCGGCLRFRRVNTNTSRRYSFVFKQPQTVEELAQAEEAVISCRPTDSIGKDGE